MFNEYDPDNLLLRQATREVLERQLEAPRLDGRARADAQAAPRVVTQPVRPTPFAFPLMVELFREKLTTEALEARVARMVAELEAAAQPSERAAGKAIPAMKGDGAARAIGYSAPPQCVRVTATSPCS